MEGYSLIHSNAQYYAAIRERLFKECALLVITAVAAVGLFLYLRKRAAELSFVEGSLFLLRRIPVDLRIFVLFFAVFCAVVLAISVSFFRCLFVPSSSLSSGWNRSPQPTLRSA